MERPRISEDARSFTLGGSPWFYLADTAWSAVTNPTDDEWELYLDRRVEQGFTAIQINVLPQWDRSQSQLPIAPFAGDGTYDFTQPNADYFERAGRRLASVRERGMVPVVVLLWCNYVPDTWASQRAPENVIPEGALDDYLRIAIECARPHGPIYFVAGDTDFQTDRAIGYYRRGLELAAELDPDGLTALHLKGNSHAIPDELLAMSELGFYTFQSGHGADHWDEAHTLARAFRGKEPTRPVVNAEPCYEGHGLGHTEGRFGPAHVRHAAWQGILAGASAGVTYGAHGIWSWHRAGLPFGSVGFSGVPFAWNEALTFPGADDYGFIRYVVDEYRLHALEPLQIDRLPPSIVAARTPDDATIAIYQPYAYDQPLTDELADRSWLRIDLSTRTTSAVRAVEVEGARCLWKGRLNGDSLLIGRQ
jgi:hypothetical protein